MTLTFPSIPADIGPGFTILVGGLVGPIPVDDTLYVFLTNHVTGQNFTYGARTKLSPGFDSVVVGYDDILRRVTSGQTTRSADRVAIDAQAFQFHAGGAVVDSSAFTPFGNLDLFTYVWTLIQYGGGGNSPFISDIRDAVIHPMPSLP